MATRFTLRALPDGEQSKERSLKRTLAGLRRRVGERGPHTLEYNGVKYNREHSTREMLLRVNELLRKANGPERVKIHPSRGPVQAIRKVLVDTGIPHINTPGTDEIDEIYSALHAQFGPQWPVRDMGICVDKPGEHGVCNAYDAGTEMDIPAEETWRRVAIMAKFLVRQGKLHAASGGKYGLPVYGVIWLDRVWKRGWISSQRYDGEKHVSHLHVSGYPSRTGWV